MKEAMAARSPELELVQIVLAAGKSERMGQPKALLRFGEQTALELVLRAARGTVSSSLVVVRADDRDLRASTRLDVAARQEWVENAALDSEQIDSLRCALRRLVGQEVDGFFLHPVDVPLVLPDDYDILARALADDSARRFQVFQPTCRGRRGHPVLCRGSLATELLELPAGGTTRDVLSRHARQLVEVDSDGTADDMDRPADYERLLQRWGGDC